MNALRSVLAGVICGTVGCLGIAEPVEEPTSSATAELAVPITECDSGDCGNSNSPEIDHLGVHDFDSTFVGVSANGFRLASYTKGGIAYRPVVYQAELTGHDLLTGEPILKGDVGPNSVVGSQFVVVNGVNEYTITIDEVDHVRYHARPGGNERFTPTYRVTWIVSSGGLPHGGGGPWKNICSHPPGGDADTLGMNRFHVVLFEGDRIDSVAKRVNRVDNNWFNIGCARHALSKQHLNGHTEAAAHTAPGLFMSTLAERTAHLKMLAGDYCGGGVPLTIAGQPLNYRDDHNWMPYATSTPVLEARWRDSGAVCLNEPRVLANSSATATATFPDIEASIKAECAAVGRSRPPSCAGPPTGIPAGIHMLSANPVPPPGP
jgi:hypothetical protein